MAHTPGPWTIQGPDAAIVGVRDGLPECIGQVFNAAHGRQYPGAWSPVSTANARLIAAAPSLMDALARLMIKLDEDEWAPDDPTDAAHVETTKAEARALLTQLEGTAR